MLLPVNSDASFGLAATRQLENDQKLDHILGNLLIAGVALSALVVVTGAVIYLFRHAAQHPEYGVFHGEPASFRTVRGILKSSSEWSGRGLVQLGLLLLIATPVARVAFSLLAFLRQRDLLYCAFTLIVLGVLLFSLMGHRL